MMAKQTKQAPALQAVPLLKYEPLYLGIDVGKGKHVAGFLSTTLLERYQRFEACPALSFENSREGFHALHERIQLYAPLEHCFVLLEKTGHYHLALLQYLQELDIPVYIIHVQERPKGMMKTDKRDALSLANHLYNQLEKGIQVADKTHLVRRAVPPTAAAAQLKGFVRHRYELSQESTQRKNKLVAICDELFPEFTKVFHDPNGEVALTVRDVKAGVITSRFGIGRPDNDKTNSKEQQVLNVGDQSADPTAPAPRHPSAALQACACSPFFPLMPTPPGEQTPLAS